MLTFIWFVKVLLKIALLLLYAARLTCFFFNLRLLNENLSWSMEEIISRKLALSEFTHEALL